MPPNGDKATPTWTPPPKDHIPDFKSVLPFLEYRKDVVKIVPVRLIVGTTVLAECLNPDWSPREEGMRKYPGGLAPWKLERLLNGWPEGRFPPLTEEYLVRGGRNENDHDYLGIHLYELEGIYFIGSGGVHRVAVAHMKGFGRLKAGVTLTRFRPDAPEALLRWIASLRQ